MSARPGRVRGARLTDLAALGELSRLSHQADDRESGVRSLGLPVSRSQMSVFRLFRLPLGGFRPSDQLYVYEEDGRLAGLARVERDPQRDEWTIVELDAVGIHEAGDIRLRLVQHLLRDGARRGAVRFHVACADAGGNVELFMQAGFISYGQEHILYQAPEAPLPRVSAEEAALVGIRPVAPLDALPLSRLYAQATPAPVARLEAYRLPDWERPGQQVCIPRSSLAPILRFAEVESFVQEGGAAGGDELVGLLQVGVAREEQPHYLRVLARPGLDASELVRYGLSIVGERTSGGRGRPGRHDQGVISPVRTYEAPLDRCFEQCGFTNVATVTLLMKEALVRVAEPALVPAIR
ncbi:MAG: hypothetical protein ACLQBX_07275 [Candidatus Limnocylindrales bacterium]